jgi:hypothetical protein
MKPGGEMGSKAAIHEQMFINWFRHSTAARGYRHTALGTSQDCLCFKIRKAGKHTSADGNIF